MKGLQYLRRMLIVAALSLCLAFVVAPAQACYAAEAQPETPTTEMVVSGSEEEQVFFLIMGGGLLIILFAVVASVSSVASVVGFVDSED